MRCLGSEAWLRALTDHAAFVEGLMGLPCEGAHIEGMGSTLSNVRSLGLPGPDIPGAALPRPSGASGTRSLRARTRESQAGLGASGLGGRLGAAPASPAQAVFSAVEPQSRLSICHRVFHVHNGMFLFAKPSSQSSGEERHKSRHLRNEMCHTNRGVRAHAIPRPRSRSTICPPKELLP